MGGAAPASVPRMDCHLPFGLLADFLRQHGEVNREIFVSPTSRDADPGFQMIFHGRRQILQPFLRPQRRKPFHQRSCFGGNPVTIGQGWQCARFEDGRFYVGPRQS